MDIRQTAEGNVVTGLTDIIVKDKEQVRKRGGENRVQYSTVHYNTVMIGWEIEGERKRKEKRLNTEK